MKKINLISLPHAALLQEILYEECTRYSDKTAVAQEVILEVG